MFRSGERRAICWQQTAKGVVKQVSEYFRDVVFKLFFLLWCLLHQKSFCLEKIRTKREKEGEVTTPVMSRPRRLGPRCRAIKRSKGLPVPTTLPHALLSPSQQPQFKRSKENRKGLALFRLLEHAANDLNQRCHSMADTFCVKCGMQQEKREGARFKPLQAQSVDLFKVS